MRAGARSLYIWGDVGRGKTMLMDVFAETAPVEAKRRVHFHAFMQEVHARIFKVRKAQRQGDAVAQVASAIGANSRLALDEMQVSYIADAMIPGACSRVCSPAKRHRDNGECA
jgi:cell division protein ZapE